MRLSDLSLTLFRFLIPPSILVTLLLYLYAPLFDCAFPVAKRAEAGCSIPGQQKAAIPAETAPFRLLAFGDPQLEGDTSLPDPNARVLPTFPQFAASVRGDGFGAVLSDVLRSVANVAKGWRKRIDLWGNDLYLAHVYRSVSWWSDPTHVVVLGDLLGSQWISDDEFQRRSQRFWGKVFKGAHKVPRSVTQSSGRAEVLGQDGSWRNRIIAVAGNHDIGYAGDVDGHRVERFEDAFGAVNWAVTLRLQTNNTASLHSRPQTSLLPAFAAAGDPELKLVILNSMNLDSPAKDAALQQASRDFASTQLSHSTRSPGSATLLLTHIPFHKEAGVCVDAPFFSWFPEGGIKEQNHLSKETSGFLLDLLTASAGKAFVLNGHDHEGCRVYHARDQAAEEWDAFPVHPKAAFSTLSVGDEPQPGVAEVTVRSMMGSFHGTAGFLSAWFDRESGEWKFEYQSCALGVQHLWWGVHVFDLVVVAFGLGGVFLAVLEEWREARAAEVRGKVKTL